ncbi:DUF1540 domain-containing protein [Chitinispirillales bacterium ANBcel5]|uniref:DUF1540 domain-containing protein n=1 Tax=Cellulosispirillum alkaliphilum TaxID=3039283 RepID=UPI002A5886BD|nr:DUF1540 domain-containing protein [Chitinispirillales bacterium ANBcel5]
MEKMEMPAISNCDAQECVYNDNGKCITYAITVGSEKPCCDTFMAPEANISKGGVQGILGSVGACHMHDCKFNSNLECSASAINVTVPSSGCPDCATYQRK